MRQRTIALIARVAAVLCAITLVRECVIDPDFDTALFTADRKWSVSSTIGSSGIPDQVGDHGPDWPRVMTFSSAEKSCDFNCVGDAAMCQGFMRRFERFCTAGDRPGHGVRIVGSVTFLEPPLCFTPLLKMGEASFTLSMTVTDHSRAENQSGAFSTKGEVDQTATGVMSCARFRHEMGKLAYEAASADMSKFMSEN